MASGASVSVLLLSAPEAWPQNEKLLVFRRFAEPMPFRRIVIAWRYSFPRPQAIDVWRAAIHDALPDGGQCDSLNSEVNYPAFRRRFVSVLGLFLFKTPLIIVSSNRLASRN